MRVCSCAPVLWEVGELKKTPRMKWDRVDKVEKWAEDRISWWAALTVQA